MIKILRSVFYILLFISPAFAWAAAPTVQATNLVFTNLTSTSATLSWTNGNGTSRAVFLKATSTTTIQAPTTNNTYTGNTAFGSGTQISTTGFYCVYNGTGTSVNITGLSATTNYTAEVIEYNGIAGAETYLTTGAPVANPLVMSTGAMLAWDFINQAGSQASNTPTSVAANLNSTVTITRGSVNTSASGSTFNATNFTSGGDSTDAVAVNKYLQFTVNASSGYNVNLNSIDVNFRKSATGPSSFIWKYSLDGFATTGVTIGNIFTFSTGIANSGTAQTQIPLSSITALQNVASGKTVTFRLYCWGATGTGGTFGFGNLTGNDLAVGGTVTASAAPVNTSTYPKVSNPLSSSLDLTSNLNIPGKTYYVAIPTTGGTAPTTVAQVLAGQDGNNNPAAASGSFVVRYATTDATKTITGLTPSTAYTIYTVSQDQSITPINQSAISSATGTTAAGLSSNADLSALSVSGGFSLSPSFAAGTTSYTVLAPTGTSSITVTPTVSDANATVKVNTVAVTSGSPSGAISLSTGTNTVSVVVTAQDASTKTYTITVTVADAPTAVTAAATGIGTTSATLNGTINDNGASTAVTFETSSVSAATVSGGSGTSASATTNATVTAGTGSVTATYSFSGLTAGTTYYYRVKGVNAAGTTADAGLSFTTLPGTPTLAGASGVNATSFNFDWTAGTGAASYSYDVATDNGFTSIVSGYNNVSTTSTNATITGLTAGTTYYFRVKAVSTGGASSSAYVSSSTATLAATNFTASYDFASSSGVSPDPTTVPLVDNATLGSFTITGATTASAAGRFNASNWNTTTNDGTKYFSVTITPASGYKLNLSGLTFTVQRSTTSGPSQYSVRSDAGSDNFTNDLPGTINSNAALSVTSGVFTNSNTTSVSEAGSSVTLGSNFSNLTSAVTFRIYGFTAGTTGGTFSVDDVKFTGTVVANNTAPVLTTTTPATSVTTTTATLSGNVSSNGGSALTDEGIVYGTSANPTIGSGTQVSAGTTTVGAFSSSVTGLTMSTLYHYQAYATNAIGTTYGGDQTFSTLAGAVITSSTPTLTGQTTNYGTAATAGTFNVSGANMGAGILVTPPTGFEVSTDNTTFASTVTVGAAGTITSTPVYVRLAAATVAGTYSGNVALTSLGATEVDVAIASSTVNAVLPTITDLPVSSVSTTAATMNATVTDGGAATTVTFLVSNVQATVAGGGGGVPTGTGNGLSITAGSGNTSSNFTDVVLSAGTTYYYQVHASNSAGSVVGAVGSFTALPSAPVAALAGNSATVASVDWPAITGAISYTYDVATDNTFSSLVSGYNSVSTTSTGVTITGLSGGTQYYFRVKAVVTGGATGAYSSTLGFVTLASPNFTANYDFNSANGTSPDLTPVPVTDHTTQGSFTASGATPSSATGRFNANTWGTGATINTSNYFSVTVTPASGYSLSLSALTFTVQRSSTGPAKYSVRSSVDNYASDITGAITGNANLTGTSIFTNTNTSAAQAGTGFTLGSSYSNLTGPITFRIYAFNASSTGTFSVDNVKFTGTTAQLPTVTTTTPATNITATTVTLSGNVSSAGSSSLTDEGIVYSTSANPTIGTGTQVSAGTTTVGAFSSSVTGLTGGTLYHYVAYATSSAGTSYGADQTFTTSSATPTISATGTLSALSTTYGTASAAGTFSVSGANMTAGILITPPTGFEVSTDNSTFTSTVTVGTTGTITSTPVYIRLKSSNAAASYSGNVVLSSSGASTVNVATASSTVSGAPITITASNVNKTYGTAITGAAGSTAYTITSGALQNSETIGSITVAYGTGSAATAAVGTYTGAVTPSAATGGTFTAANYNITYATGDIIVGTAAITITANNASKTYGTALTSAAGSTAYTITSGALQNSETIGSITVAYGTGSAATAAVGTYTGAVTPSAATGGTFTASNYNITYASGNIVTGTANLTITANNANKIYGATLTGGAGSTAYAITSGALQNSETIGSVTIAYGTGSAATATAGTYTGSVTPSAATGGSFTASNYNITYAAGDIVVGKADITITANNANKSYGTALSGGTGSTAYAITSGALQNSETIGSISIAYGTGAAATAAVGTYTGAVTPSAATGGTFTAANYNITYATGNIVVGTAAITITANNATKSYGTALSGGSGSVAYTISSGSLQNSETIGSVTIAYGTGAAATAVVGTYTGSVTPSAATGGTFTASNYNITYATGDIVVGKADITITASNANKSYGATLTGGSGSTAYTITAGSLQNSETIGSVTIAYGTGSAATAATGTYTGSVTPSAATGGTFTASNYNITYATGNIIVAPVNLTVTATGPSKTYGTALSAGTSTTNFTVTGTLVTGEALTGVTLTPDAAGLSATTATGAAYVVTPSAATGTGGFLAGNYNITYTPFSGTVSAASLTITATSASKTYGTALTAGTSTTNFTVTGTLASGEAVTSVTLTPDAAGLSATTAVGSSYAVTPSAATGTGGFLASNYNITYTPYNGTVTTGTLTVTATGPTKKYGVALTAGPVTTNFSVSGTLAPGEALTGVTLTPNAAGLSATTAAGTGYVVTPSAATGTGGFLASNYNITYLAYNGTVSKTTVLITAANVNKVFGNTLTSGTGFTSFSSAGLAGSETIGSVTVTYGTGAAASDAIGTYTGQVQISAATGGTFNSSNYNFSYAYGNIVVTATPTPAIIVTGNLSAFTGTFGTASSSDSFNVSGTNMTAGITVTPPSGFEVSSDNTTFASTVTIGSAGTISSTPVYVRLLSTNNAGNYSGSVVMSSSGATNASTIIPTSTVSKYNLTITANTANKTYGNTLTGGAGSAAYSITSGTLQNGNTISTVTITYGTGAAATDPVATNTGTAVPSAAVGGNGFSVSNYNINYAGGNIVVGAVAITITANTANKTYGSSLTSGAGSSAFTVSSGALANSETINTVTLTYGTGSAATAAVGTYTGQVTPSLATGGTFTASNYSITYAAGNIVVGATAITITANTANKSYGSALTSGTGSTAYAITSGSLKNSETLSSVTIAYGTGALATDAVGTYTGQVTPSAAVGANGFVASNYNITYTVGNIVVSKANLTIAATGPAKTYGTALTAGTSTTNFTAGTTVNGETVTSVTLTPDAAGLSANTAAGATYNVTPSLATGSGGFLESNYNVTYTPFSGTVGKIALTVTATGPSKTYGTALTAGASTANFTVTGTAASGEALTSVTLTPDAAGLSATTAAGASYTVTPSAATGTGGFAASNYNITYTPFSGTVGKIPLTVTATGPAKTYGTALAAGTSTTNFTVTGTPASGEALSGVTLTPDAAGLSAATAAGTAYIVTPSAATGTGGFVAGNYNITYAPFSGTVGKIALTVTATGPAKTYGTALTTGTSITNFTVTGTPVSGEALTSVTLTPDAAGLSATTAAGAAYVIIPSAATGTGGFAAGNYNITYTPFSGIVSKIALTVTATGPLKTYGTALSAGTSTTNFTVTGTLNSGEALTGVTLTPDAVGLSATTAAGAGYVVTPSAATGTGGFAAGNYNITYTPYNGTVAKTALTVTANNANKNYGQTLTGASGSTAFTPTGLQNSETIGSVTIAYGTGAAATAAVGTYTGSVTPSVATGGTFTAANYNITYNTGNIIVGAAPLTITANNVNKITGATLTGAAGSTAFTTSGLQNSETVGTVTIAYGTGAAAGDAPGTYTAQVTPSAATGGTFTAGNYNITYTKGDIIIGTPTISTTGTLSALNTTYGTASANSSFSISGSNLSNDISVAAPTGFEVSTSASGGFGTSLTLTRSGGIVSSTAVYIRLSATAAANSYSGNVVLTSTGATTVNVATVTSTVSPAALTITASNTTKTYGTALTGAAGSTAYSIAGGSLQNGNTISSVTIVYGTGSAATAAANTYTGQVTPSAAVGANGFVSSNYNITYTAGDIIVNKATLTITATGPTKTYGTALTTGTSAANFTASATVNSETVTGVTLTPDAAGLSATTAAGAGYTVTPSLATGGNGFAASNYNIIYIPYSGTVSKAALTVTATGPAKTYGTALTAGTSTANFTVAGTISGETVSSVTLTPDAAGLSATTAAGSAYTVTPSAATGTGGFATSNYTVTYVPFNGTVGKIALTVTATGPAKAYGTALTAGTSATNFTVTGTLNSGEAVTGVTLTPDAAGLSASTGAGTAYVVTPSAATGTGGFAAGNYTITYVPFNGTVSKAALSITANSTTKVYGATNPTLGVTYTGFVGTDNVASLTTQPSIVTTAATTSPVGIYPITASGAVSNNYTFNYTAGALTVTPATLTIAASNATKVYGTANPALAVTYTGFVGADNAASLTTQPTVTTTALTTSPVGNYPITASGAVSSNYTISYTVGTLAVTPATLTIAANNAAKTYGAVNPTLGVTYTGFVGTDNAASLTTQPGIVTTAVTGSPVGTYPITVSGAVSSNYTFSYTAGTLTVTPATLTITASNATKVYGAANPTLGVTYTGFVGTDNAASLTTQPSVVTTAVTGSQVGTYPITASGAVSNNYTFNYTAGTLTVTPATLTIVASNATKVYGAANPTLAVTYTGFVGADNAASLTTQPTVSTTAVSTSPVGTYPITASGAVSPNYNFSYTAGTLTVTPATLTIAANNTAKTYGTINPTLGITYTGFVGTDNAASLTTQPNITTTAVTGSAVGTYPITASGAVSANYTIGYTAGTLTVNKAALTIAANNAAKVYGAVNPALGVTYTGFVNGDTNTSLTTQPTIATTAVTSSPAGTYPVTASGAAAANYTISYTAGTLTVTPATLTIAASSGTKVYGAANPAFTVSYTGFVNGDTNASLTTQPTIATTAVTGSPVGTYPVTANGAVSANYTISYTAGTVTVTPVALNIAASNVTKVYGSVNPVLGATYTGFVNGDTNASLTTQPTLTTTAVTGSPVGTYPINATGAVSSNYTITYTAGALTVTQAPLTITAANQTKILNTANPTLTATYAGFVNGDTNTSLTTQPTLVTTAVLASPVGTYPITASGAASANYSISYVPGTLTVTASPNANLANLIISSGTLSPVFAVATTAYTASVGNAVTSVTITPTTADPTSTVKVNGVTVTSGNASGSIPLAVGANTITTVVTAQNGTTTVTYTVVVTRAPSGNASLANLVLSSGTLTPVFAPATYTYTALVDNTVSQIVLTPTLADATATILLNGQPAANAQGATLNLLVGDNAISVFTTAQDGVTKLTYTLTIHRATPPELIRPNNILSPNGDGKNDTWIVKDIQSYPNNTVKVYDRAGRIIYSKHTYANDWNGTYQGNTLAEGTYYYVIDLGTGDDAIKGFVTIVRSR